MAVAVGETRTPLVRFLYNMRKEKTLSVLQKHNPDRYASLIDFYEKTGRIHKTKMAQVYKARHLYIAKFYNAASVAKTIKVPLSVVERWIQVFGWDMERDRRLFVQFKKFNQLTKTDQALDERHDRLFGSIESIAEEYLNKAQDEQGTLDMTALKNLTDILQKTMTARRTLRKVEDPAKRVTHSIESPELFKSVMAAVLDTLPKADAKLIAHTPAPQEIKTTHKSLVVHDRELEEVEDTEESEE